MKLRSEINIIRNFLLIVISSCTYNLSVAQQTPLNPLSYWVFTPYVYNPAIVGSKDYLTLDLNAAFQGKNYTQILSGNTRLSKTAGGYFGGPKFKEFNRIGIGGSVFNDKIGSNRNIGGSLAGSYQVPLSKHKLSFLSIGASVKGVYNMIDTSSSEAGNPLKKTLYPNLDAGIYYFGTNLFTGVSSVNMLGNPGDPDSLGNYDIQVSREYYFTLGYKFVISKKLNMVLEPSLLVMADDSSFNDFDIEESITPILKFYLDNFLIGSYFMNDGNTSFFFQYRYPRFHIGAFYELPRKTAYYKKAPIVELTFGLNFQVDKSRSSGGSRW